AIEHPLEVLRPQLHRVGAGGLGAPTRPALVVGNRPIPRRLARRELGPPGIGRSAEAVNEDDGGIRSVRSRAAFVEDESDAVDLDPVWHGIQPNAAPPP